MRSGKSSESQEDHFLHDNVYTKFMASFSYSCGHLPGLQKLQPLITLVMVLLLYLKG